MLQIVTAARKNVLIRELEDEVLLYDSERGKVHCLNRTAALVWKHCDGKTSVDEILHMLQNESKSPVDRNVVRLAVEQLNKARLLEEPIPPRDSKSKGLTRRELIRKLGAASAIALPVISSILLLPTAAHASGPCFGTGHPCTMTGECCSGLCVLNRCV